MNKLLAANPKDPIGLLARGELRLDDGKLKDAVADFKEAEKNDLPKEKVPLLREKLYIAYTELLRADFNSAESFLKEYEALCEVSRTGDAPEDILRQKEETDRRQRLYLYLLAKGRESQGKLGEAFDHYLALANKGEGKTLLEMPDEPNVRMRPDVWARGRIEAMIRKADSAAARKSLEDRVEKAWVQVKDGKDLKALREFVTVFGPYFASGTEAQFKLADVLLSTNNDADLREAQSHLAQLRVTADDPATRARATEALAQLMIKNRMMEDAVALYLQLGKEYPDVVIRDGKTGADFLTDLLTDKRLFPFLEPRRYPMPERVKAEERLGAQPGINYSPQFEIETPPDLFPMYRQWRFTLDQFNGPFALRGIDRATGVERVRFSSMANPNLYSRTGVPIPYSKFVQGNGHLMLVQLGLTVYCLDLAEKKELWHKTLLDIPMQPGMSYQVDVTGDDECTIRFPNNTTVTLGRSAILQPGYVCLLTSDGLECVEPLTRRILWTRKGVAERTHLYGDARYIVLVETDATSRKPTATKLLRAVDGMVFEGSPDSGRVLSGAKSFRIYGRHALLAEGTGDQPRVLRLYDLATGKDVWKKEFDAKAVPITSPLNSEWTGYVKSDGTAEVYSVRTGESVAKLKIDEKLAAEQMKSCVEAQLLADAERFYLVLDRDPNAPSTNGTRRVPVYNNYMLRSQKVNGPIYAFDRGSGKRLWHYADVLENQWLVLEQFGDLPVILAAAPVMNPNNQYTHAVVVIEKDRGRLVLNKNVTYNGNFFQSLTVDQKNGTISMNRYDTRIVVTPDEVKPEK
jgi:outer membrane protein assembly factor BamB